MAELVTMTIDHALQVARRMRPMDAECVRAAMGPDIDPETFAVGRYETHGPAWAVVDGGAAVAVFGLQLINGWCAVAWLVATDAMSLQSWRKVARTSATVVANALDPSSPHHRHRIEAHVLEGWPEAQALAERLGMRKEGVRRMAGHDGQDVGIWAVTARERTQR